MPGSRGTRARQKIWFSSPSPPLISYLMSGAQSFQQQPPSLPPQQCFFHRRDPPGRVMVRSCSGVR